MLRLLDAYELLQQFYEHGVFHLLRGVLGASDKLIETAVDAAKSDESVRAMRNAIILGKLLGPSTPTCWKASPWQPGNLGSYQKPVIEPRGFSHCSASFGIRSCAEALR